jgi:hypothetical protein
MFLLKVNVKRFSLFYLLVDYEYDVVHPKGKLKIWILYLVTQDLINNQSFSDRSRLFTTKKNNLHEKKWFLNML